MLFNNYYKLKFFYGQQGHLYDCFPHSLMYNINILCHICIAYIVKEVESFQGAWSNNGHGGINEHVFKP